MSADNFTEVTQRSWMSRIGGAIKGVLVGLILFVVAFPVLFLNEGRAVQRYKTLKEGAGAVVTVTCARVDPAQEGKLVHTTGKADTSEMLADPVFGVTVNALKLKRRVEMYQWKETSRSETRKKLGGGEETIKIFSYSRIWSDELIRSGDFHDQAGHQNPASFSFEPAEQVARKVTLGAFELSASLVQKICNFEPLTVGNGTTLPPSLEGKAKLLDGGFYIGADPTFPQVGDSRIKFMAVQPTDVSVMARQTGSSFAPYATKVGGTIELLQTSVQTADAMIQSAQQSNKILTWILRFVGFILMLMGLNLIFAPLAVLADVLPILGTIVGAGTGIISFMISSVLSLITVAIAWIVYRPILGATLLVVAVVVAVVIRGKLKPAPATA